MKSNHLISNFVFVLIISNVICTTFLDLLFTPIVNYELTYKEKVTQIRHELKLITRKICVRLDDEATKKMVRELTCLETNFNQYMKSMASIWWQATGTNYPSNINEWRRYICSTKYFKILKSLMDGVYLSRLVKDGSQSRGIWPPKFAETYKAKCPNIHFDQLTMISFRNVTYDIHGDIIIPDEEDLNDLQSELQVEPKHGIVSDEDDYNESVDFCDLDKRNLTKSQVKYCNLKNELATNYTLGCSSTSIKSNKIRKEWIEKHKCIERNIVNKRQKYWLNQCWKLITGYNYPKNDNEFVNFTCKHIYSKALRKTIDNCYDDRINGRHVSLNFIKYRLRQLIHREDEHINNLVKSCSFVLWKKSDIEMYKIYSLRYYRLQFEYEKHNFCTMKDVNLIGQVISDATCPMRKTTNEGKIVLKFCWKFAGQVEYPSTFNQWKNLFCSKGPKQLAEMIFKIDTCFALAPNIIFGDKFEGSHYILAHYFFTAFKVSYLNNFFFCFLIKFTLFFLTFFCVTL